jgi:hypothetical protein
VAKRVRGQRSSHRAGGQAAPQRVSPEASVSRLSVTGPAPDIDAAIDSVFLEETALTIEEPTTTMTTPSMRPRRSARVKADSLQARMAAEDVYVREDLRRILMVSAVLFAGLALAWFVFVFLDVLGLY